jgi:uncharacterized protein (DUF305 family)
MSAIAPAPLLERPLAISATPRGRPGSPRRHGLIAVAGAAALALSLAAGGLAGQIHLGFGSDAAPSAVDVGFSQDMITHHQQAVDMAQIVLTRASPTVSSLAQVIHANQTEQIGEMHGWLTVWGRPMIGTQAPMAWLRDERAMRGMQGSPASAMPGMATEEELARLRSGGRKATEAQFLRLMIRHHQGGILMASYAAAHASSTAVQELARRDVYEQTLEIQQMLPLLARLGVKPLPVP